MKHAALGFALCLVTMPAFADPARQDVVQLLTDDGPGFAFFELGSERSLGADVAVSVVDVDQIERIPRPAVAQVEHLRTRVVVSCTWRTYRVVGRDRLEPDGRFGQAESINEAGWYAQFATAGSPMRQVIDLACGGAPDAQARTFPSGASAISWADEEIRRRFDPSAPPPPLTIRPLAGASRPFPQVGPTPPRFAAATSRSADGSVAFLDWANLERAGTVVKAWSLYVLGPGDSAESRAFGLVVALRRTRYDCSQNNAAVALEYFWDVDGRSGGSDTRPQLVRRVAPEEVEAEVMKAVCSGQQPSESYPGIGEAVAFAQSSWPTKTQASVVPVVASEGPPPPPPQVVRNPEWVEKPTIEDVDRAYPRRALRMGVSGQAVIQCEVTAAGSLRACTVASEDPADFGFGAAALKMVPLFKLSPEAGQGTPIEGALIRIPIRFEPP